MDTKYEAELSQITYQLHLPGDFSRQPFFMPTDEEAAVAIRLGQETLTRKIVALSPLSPMSEKPFNI